MVYVVYSARQREPTDSRACGLDSTIDEGPLAGTSRDDWAQRRMRRSHLGAGDLSNSRFAAWRLRVDVHWFSGMDLLEGRCWRLLR